MNGSRFNASMNLPYFSSNAYHQVEFYAFVYTFAITDSNITSNKKKFFLCASLASVSRCFQFRCKRFLMHQIVILLAERKNERANWKNLRFHNITACDASYTRVEK